MLANLKATLAARQVRQVDLALSLNIPPSIFSEIVNQRREASRELRNRIAQALQADTDWLFSSVTAIPPLMAEQLGHAGTCAMDEGGDAE
jgi:transcriptional regulator with XRE-family HTH domain